MLAFQILSGIGVVVAGIVLFYAYAKKHPEILKERFVVTLTIYYPR